MPDPLTFNEAMPSSTRWSESRLSSAAEQPLKPLQVAGCRRRPNQRRQTPGATQPGALKVQKRCRRQRRRRFLLEELHHVLLVVTDGSGGSVGHGLQARQVPSAITMPPAGVQRIRQRVCIGHAQWSDARFDQKGQTTCSATCSDSRPQRQPRSRALVERAFSRACM